MGKGSRTVSAFIIPHLRIEYVSTCVSYPEHVYTWEGYGNRSVSLCVCLHLVAS